AGAAARPGGRGARRAADARPPLAAAGPGAAIPGARRRATAAVAAPVRSAAAAAAAGLGHRRRRARAEPPAAAPGLGARGARRLPAPRRAVLLPRLGRLRADAQARPGRPAAD